MFFSEREQRSDQGGPDSEVMRHASLKDHPMIRREVPATLWDVDLVKERMGVTT